MSFVHSQLGFSCPQPEFRFLAGGVFEGVIVHRVGTGRAVKLGKRHVVVVAGLKLRGPCAGEGDAGVEHVELCTCPRGEAFFSKAQSLVGLFDGF